jgi:colicin import membrane protein
MSRFEKKCFVGSATFHGLLLVVIFFGAAFMPKDKLSDMGPVVEFNPGGAPAPKGAAPADPPQPAPATPPQQEKVEPPPPQETVKQPNPVPPKITKREQPKEKEVEKEKGDLPVPVKKETTKKEKDEPKPKSLVNTTVVRRSNVVDQTAMKLAQARRDAALKAERAAQAADAARRNDAINAVNKIVGSAGDSSSNTRVASTTAIGNGTGAGSGMATGRYGDGLKAIYDSRWVLPTDAYDDEAVAQVRVTVRRDGTVVSSSITKPSGNASFDRSVRAVLNNVTRVLPFPPEMKEAERVFTWRFEKRTRLG